MGKTISTEDYDDDDDDYEDEFESRFPKIDRIVFLLLTLISFLLVIFYFGFEFGNKLYFTYVPRTCSVKPPKGKGALRWDGTLTHGHFAVYKCSNDIEAKLYKMVQCNSETNKWDTIYKDTCECSDELPPTYGLLYRNPQHIIPRTIGNNVTYTCANNQKWPMATFTCNTSSSWSVEINKRVCRCEGYPKLEGDTRIRKLNRQFGSLVTVYCKNSSLLPQSVWQCTDSGIWQMILNNTCVCKGIPPQYHLESEFLHSLPPRDIGECFNIYCNPLSNLSAIRYTICCNKNGEWDVIEDIPCKKYYHVFDKRLDYYQAQTYCESLGGFLPRIKSEEDIHDLSNLCDEPKSCSKYYFGVVENLNRTWISSDGRFVNMSDLLDTSWTNDHFNCLEMQIDDDDDRRIVPVGCDKILCFLCYLYKPRKIVPFEIKVTYVVARWICHDKNGLVAPISKIDSIFEVEISDETIDKCFDGFFIGGRNWLREWMNTDGTELRYSNFEETHSNFDENCVVMSKKYGYKWVKVECYTLACFICELSVEPSKAPSKPKSREQWKVCPRDWFYHDDSCYSISLLAVNSSEAEILCNSTNSSLLYVKSEEEQIFVENLVHLEFKDLEVQKGFLTGMRRSWDENDVAKNYWLPNFDYNFELFEDINRNENNESLRIRRFSNASGEFDDELIGTTTDIINPDITDEPITSVSSANGITAEESTERTLGTTSAETTIGISAETTTSTTILTATTDNSNEIAIETTSAKTITDKSTETIITTSDKSKESPIRTTSAETIIGKSTEPTTTITDKSKEKTTLTTGAETKINKSTETATAITLSTTTIDKTIGTTSAKTITGKSTETITAITDKSKENTTGTISAETIIDKSSETPTTITLLTTTIDNSKEKTIGTTSAKTITGKSTETITAITDKSKEKTTGTISAETIIDKSSETPTTIKLPTTTIDKSKEITIGTTSAKTIIEKSSETPTTITFPTTTIDKSKKITIGTTSVKPVIDKPTETLTLTTDKSKERTTGTTSAKTITGKSTEATTIKILNATDTKLKKTTVSDTTILVTQSKTSTVTESSTNESLITSTEFPVDFRLKPKFENETKMNCGVYKLSEEKWIFDYCNETNFFICRRQIMCSKPEPGNEFTGLEWNGDRLPSAITRYTCGGSINDKRITESYKCSEDFTWTRIVDNECDVEYHAFAMRFSWKRALDTCKSLDGTLAMMENIYQQRMIKNEIRKVIDHQDLCLSGFYLGLKEDLYNYWKVTICTDPPSQSGAKVLGESEMWTDQRRLRSDQCVIVNKESGFFLKTEDCSKKNCFVCENSVSKYEVIREYKNYTDAYDYCQSLKLQLAVVRSTTYFWNLRDFLKSSTNISHCYNFLLGFRSFNFSLKWLSGVDVFPELFTHNPELLHYESPCVVQKLGVKGELDGTHCHHLNCFVCQLPPQLSQHFLPSVLEPLIKCPPCFVLSNHDCFYIETCKNTSFEVHVKCLNRGSSSFVTDYFQHLLDLGNVMKEKSLIKDVMLWHTALFSMNSTSVWRNLHMKGWYPQDYSCTTLLTCGALINDEVNTNLRWLYRVPCKKKANVICTYDPGFLGFFTLFLGRLINLKLFPLIPVNLESCAFLCESMDYPLMTVVKLEDDGVYCCACAEDMDDKNIISLPYQDRKRDYECVNAKPCPDLKGQICECDNKSLVYFLGIDLWIGCLSLDLTSFDGIENKYIEDSFYPVLNLDDYQYRCRMLCKTKRYLFSGRKFTSNPADICFCFYQLPPFEILDSVKKCKIRNRNWKISDTTLIVYRLANPNRF